VGEGGIVLSTSQAYESPKGQAKQAGEQVREKTQEAGGQVRDKMRQEVDNRTTQAGDRVSSTANDIRTVGDELRKNGKDGPAQIADEAAERVERVGNYLKSADADQLLNDIENLARQRPWAVIAGGITLGLVASRLLKTSSGQRYSSYQARWQPIEREIPSYTTSTPSYGGATDLGDPFTAPVGVEQAGTPDVERTPDLGPVEPPLTRPAYSSEEEREDIDPADVGRSSRSPEL
jgi:ElaB/YqjD/DUF883 family membrane-anchored ribosome-binding protein